jgi:hypothetical protein
VSPPSELKFVANSIRKAAGIWDQQASAVGTASDSVAGMGMGRVEAGVFQLIVGPYDQVVSQVSARCEEGMHNMRAIASALDKAADIYSHAEQTNTSNANTVQTG